MAKPKKYKCPYCELRADRESLITHIIDNHEEMIPEGFSARRVVFNYINHKDHGNCVICKKPTKWIEEAGHYDRFCENPKCREAARKKYVENIQKVRGTTNLLEDPEFQKKMLSARKISGTYKFADGGIRSYTGSYEKKLLEFADKVLNIKSEHIMTPGPTLEYSYNGETHKWIIDQYWVPWNLLIEVKDGGAHPNNRNMTEYRTKQICKEVMVTDLGTYNYLRLTDNQFPQLIEILMEIKKENMSDTPQNVIKIYESALNEMTHHLHKPFKDPRNQHGVFFVAYSFESYVDDESIEGFAIADDLIPSKILRIKDNKIAVEEASFLNNRKIAIYKYIGDKSLKDIMTNESVSDYYFYEALTGKKMYLKEQAELDYENFEAYDPMIFKSMKEAYEATTFHEFNDLREKTFYFPMMSAYDKYVESLLINGLNGISILEDVDGYFVFNDVLNQRSKSFSSINEISVDLVRQIANTNIRRIPYNDCTDILPFSIY